MKNKFYAYPLIVCALVCGASAQIFADTIRLKDGTVIRGQIVGFRDQQFTVLMANTDRGRRSRVMLYMEDVESIEFDAAGAETTAAPGAGGAAAPSTTTNTANRPPQQQQQQPTISNVPRPANTTPPTAAATTSQAGTFFPVTVRVRADNSTNGWTNSGLVVRRGQRLRIIASGRVSLGSGRYSTPTGIGTLADKAKLMQNEPTGSLIAVIGDDNDDFILVGGRRELIAQRDGVLFLGVNEGDLNDNSGAYDVTIEAEAAARAAQ